MSSYTTVNRTRILEFLQTCEDHAVTVAEIQAELTRQGSPVNVTTIYRFLDKLEKDGTVLHFASESGDRTLYQYIRQGRHCPDHLHLKCVRCGALLHLDCSFMDVIAAHIEAEHGFQLQCKTSVLYGLCSQCRKAE